MDGLKATVSAEGCGPLNADASDLGRPLRLRIFDYVRASGLVSRSQIAKDLRVSPGSVSPLAAELIEQGYLRETSLPRGTGDAGRGRPPVALVARADAFVVAGVKIADRQITGIVIDSTGRQLASMKRSATPGPHPLDDQIERLAGIVGEMCAMAGIAPGNLSAVGVGLPGFVDHAAGHVFWSPVLDGRNLPVVAAAQAHLGVPVVIDNDANLVALAELWFGVGREMPDFAVVTIEHGVGTGIVLDHRLFRGAHGVGLELGHTKVQLDGALCRCGQRGCLEAYISDYALAREAETALRLPVMGSAPADELIERLFTEARNGHAAAQSIFDRAGRYLALGLANVVNLFDPSLLILSGDRMRYDDHFVGETLEQMRSMVLDTGLGVPPLKIHEWGTLLWAHGAAALALSSATETALGGGRETAG